MSGHNVTQAVINSLVRAEFAAQEAHDQACTDRDAMLCALVAQVAYVPGVPATEDAVADFKDIASEYQAAWIALTKCDVLSSGRQWQRVCNRAGIVKPQTKEAIKKQELRAAKSAADKVNPKGAPVAPASGVDTAKRVINLTADDVHLIGLLHAKKYAQAHDFIRSVIEAKAA